MTTNQVVEIQDDYTHFSSKVEYIYENVLCDYEECSNADKDEYLTLKENYNTLLLNTCKGCRGPMMCHNCHFGPNYRYSATARELLLVTYREHTLIYECSAMCGCNPEQCHNRVVQFGPRKNLQVKFSMKYRSFGVFTNRPIPANAFICEYVGELLTQSIARRRVNANYKKKMMNYLVCLQETPIEPLNTGEAEPRPKYLTYLDPSRRGNVARYINHSCDPNCQTYSVRVDSPIPRIGKFLTSSLLYIYNY